MKELYIIVNERIYGDNKSYFCENKDIQSIINYFFDKYFLIVISRYSDFAKPFKLKKVFSIFNLRLNRIFNFCLFFFYSLRKKKF